MELLDAICGRRSIRRFTEDAVDENDLRTILRAAAMAPSGHNDQMWYFVVVKDRVLQTRMKEAVVDEHRRLAEVALRHGGLEDEAKRLQNPPRNGPSLTQPLLR